MRESESRSACECECVSVSVSVSVSNRKHKQFPTEREDQPAHGVAGKYTSMSSKGCLYTCNRGNKFFFRFFCFLYQVGLCFLYQVGQLFFVSGWTTLNPKHILAPRSFPWTSHEYSDRDRDRDRYGCRQTDRQTGRERRKQKFALTEAALHK